MSSSRVVGIGASAGGLESIEQLFSALPPDTGMTFVVIQHLSPDFRSLMDELIARRSTMPVVVAEDGMEVLADHIYLLPPRKEMIIRGRKLVLTDKPHGLSLPIDVFFRSLAQDVGVDAVAIVLSGSGSDGSRGIVDVKRAGGVVMVESAVTAKFDGMPLSAQETGLVDHSASPRDLARLLCGLPPLEPVDPEDDIALSEDPAMDSLLRLLRDTFGIDFSLYKMTTVSRRVKRRVELLQIASLPAYVDQLREDPFELNALYQDLLIGVTQFFRDHEAFETIEREIIPHLLDQIPPEQEIRVWIAGCATGEEAYSLAILFHEALAARNRPVNVKILATDVHPSSLEAASIGIYGDEQLANVSEARRERFFTRRTSGLQISQELRQLIVFARHNVTKDAPFTRMHFISCRNLLIYLQPPAQRTVLSLFHFGLASGGVLFLGASETLGSLSEEFITIEEHWKLFRKRRDVALLGHVKLPMGSPLRRPAFELSRPQGTDPHVLATYDQLLDRFMPPSMLVDEDRNLIDSFGGAEKMLQMPRRRPTNNVLEMVDEELRTVLAGAIQRALKDRAPVAFSGVKLRANEGERRCTVTALPFVHPRTGVRSVLVTFERQEEQEASPQAVAPLTPSPVPAEQVTHEHLETLETELTYTRETLQATIEELETSNEEMQATNEELVASNEELQSTNEELHSVNEELYTVNAEYQQKIAELKELNTDIQHLLEGTDVGTVFLDRELRIRRFTSRIASVFRIQSEDIGRQINDFSHNIVRPSLMDDLQRVRRNGEVIEAEVSDREGTPYFLRILPYRVARGASPAVLEPAAIDGVVLSITDISALERARAGVAQLSAIVESSENAIVGATIDGIITSWNGGAERMYGYTAEQTLGRSLRMLFAPEAGVDLQGMISPLREGKALEATQQVHQRTDGSRLDVSVTLSPVYDRHGTPLGCALIVHDISQVLADRRELEQRQTRIESLLESSEEASRRREQFLAMLSHELRNPLGAILTATALLHGDADPALAARSRAVIERQVLHVSRLLDDLLDVSRITRGKFELRPELLDLRGSIESAIESTAPHFATRNVELDVGLPEEPVPVRGDLARLQQVTANLLSNAATYSPPRTRVDLRLAVHGDHAILRVADRGYGIENSMLGRIFDLFVQAEQRLDRTRGGLGVGLSLARTIVELHGGTIEARSDGADMGSEFVVKLPLELTEQLPAPRAPLQRGPRRRIVLVEDQLDSREMLRMLLEALDHVVLDAGDGMAAIELIEREKPDAALIDIGLPMMNGYEVAQQIRSRKHLGEIFLVALTGYGTASDVAAARAAGFDAHLIKPADLRRLEELLATGRAAAPITS